MRSGKGMRWQIPLCRRLQYQVRWPYQQQQGNAQWIREIVMSWHMVPPDRGESVVRYLQLRCMAAEYLLLFPPLRVWTFSLLSPIWQHLLGHAPMYFYRLCGLCQHDKRQRGKKKKKKKALI